jgi:hypothetical protein
VSLASERKELFLTLYNDAQLKTLMKIPAVDINNMAKVRDTYITHAYGSDTIILSESCRILYRNVPLSATNNQFVKWDGIIFEIFVKDSDQYNVTTNALDRRQEMIADRLLALLGRQYVGDLKFEPVDKGDLYCATSGYKRYFVLFKYKRIF